MKIGVKWSVNGPNSLILPLKDKKQVEFLSLDGDILDAALELHDDETNIRWKQNGMIRYKKDDAISKFQVLEVFEQYTSNVLILEYINGFEKRLNKVKIYGGDMPESFLHTDSWKIQTLNKTRATDQSHNK